MSRLLADAPVRPKPCNASRPTSPGPRSRSPTTSAALARRVDRRPVPGAGPPGVRTGRDILTGWQRLPATDPCYRRELGPTAWAVGLLRAATVGALPDDLLALDAFGEDIAEHVPHPITGNRNRETQPP